MANLAKKPGSPAAEKANQAEIKLYEDALAERYQAHNQLQATNATAEEIQAVKDEITLLLDGLRGLYSGTTS